MLTTLVGVAKLVVDPQTPATVYAGQRLHNTNLSYGLFKTTDRGDSWSAINNGLPQRTTGISISDLAIDPQSPA